MSDLPAERLRLTHLVKSAGCAAKISPTQLHSVLHRLILPEDSDRLVGFGTSDDAGVYRLTPDLALVQTIDFFTPIVDDPYRYGQIAAANSLSDVYAMGGKPITAMNVLCYPIRDRDAEELAEILRGGADKVAEAGASLVGGHSIEGSEPKFGLSVTGIIDPAHIATNAGAQPGDVIVLTKPLGTGIVTTAAKFDDCTPDVLEAACQSMAKLNAGAAEAMRKIGIGADLPIHAATDITGFGLFGHLFHIAKASHVALEIDSQALPALPDISELIARKNITRGDRENKLYLGDAFEVAPDVEAWRISLVFDPQTSGGLAICVAPSALDALLAELRAQGTLVQAVIGRVVAADTPKLLLK